MRIFQEDFEMIELLLLPRFRESGGNDIGMPSSRLSANLSAGLFLRSERVTYG